jgi:hypothetical protein
MAVAVVLATNLIFGGNTKMSVGNKKRRQEIKNVRTKMFRKDTI